MRVQTTYADSSVFGGVFATQFAMPSREFFDLVEEGRFKLMVSDISRKEISMSPPKVRALFDELLPLMHLVAIDEEVLQLRDGYREIDIRSPAEVIDYEGQEE